jgi:hypothetical protein
MSNTPIPQYVIETSRVPFGYEPTTICWEPSMEDALATLELLRSLPESEELCYEICEA